jgi:cell division protein ZipA
MDAATLRIILLVIGIAFLIALFLWELRRSSRMAARRVLGSPLPATAKREPNLGLSGNDQRREIEDASAWHDHAFDASLDPNADPTTDGIGSAANRRDDRRPLTTTSEAVDIDPADLDGLVTATPSGLIVQLFVVARAGLLSGRDLLVAASRHLLIAGDKDIFHRMDGNPDQPRTLFSMANLVQPGSFPLQPDATTGMAEFETRGIALFTQAQGEAADIEALDALLATAKSLARELNAEVEDARHRAITIKRIESLRALVIGNGGAGHLGERA